MDLSRGGRTALTFPFLASVCLALCGFGAPAEGSYGVRWGSRGPLLVTLDPEGNRTEVRTPKGPTTTFEYDELGKLTKVTQSAVLVYGPDSDAPTLQVPVTTYAYDESRNRVLQTDANLHSVKMEYDELNRLKRTIQDPRTAENPTGLNLVTETVEFDENGNPLVVRDPKGQTITSTFDELNRLKTKSFAFAPGDDERPWRYTASLDYGYDENGNLLTTDEHVASGTDPPEPPLRTVREYDRLDRLTKETQPLPDRSSREVSYAYYGNGLRKTVTDPADSITQYAYDGQNRLEAATTGFGGAEAATTRYTYWPDDLLHTVSYPNGVVSAHDYDKADRLFTLANAKGATSVSSYTYSYDPNGNRLSQVEVNGGRTETTGYTYDDLDRLASVTYPVDAAYPQGRVVSYGYDAVGNRRRETEKNSAGTLLADKQGVFDHANRLTDLQDLVTPAQSTSFTWDPNGNQRTKTVDGTTTEYRYDLRDKLVEVVQGPSTLGRFQYDADGRRNLKIGEEGLRHYVYDQTSLLAEYDAAGLQKAKYDYGSDRLIRLTRPGDEGRRYFSLDGLRSVVNLTDDSGSAVASYHLDAWGNFRFPQELTASANRFAFTGHIFDTETGLYNAKARYFDPKLGRFLTQDSFLGQIDEPPSLHRHLYANDNPTTFVDPTGHAALRTAPKDELTLEQAQELYAQTEAGREARELPRNAPDPAIVEESPQPEPGVLSKLWSLMDSWESGQKTGGLTRSVSRQGLNADAMSEEAAARARALAGSNPLPSGMSEEDVRKLAQGDRGAVRSGASEAAGAFTAVGVAGAIELGKQYGLKKLTEKVVEAVSGAGTRLARIFRRGGSKTPPAVPGVGGGSTTPTRKAEDLVTWVDEGGNMRAGRSAGMRPDASRYQASAPGARSNVLTGRSQAPYLEFTDEAGNTVGAKFDGVRGAELVDRKMNPFFSAKAVDQAARQVAVANHYNLEVVWELPTQQAAGAANRFLQSNKISGIAVRVVPQ